MQTGEGIENTLLYSLGTTSNSTSVNDEMIATLLSIYTNGEVNNYTELARSADIHSETAGLQLVSGQQRVLMP